LRFAKFANETVLSIEMTAQFIQGVEGCETENTCKGLSGSNGRSGSFSSVLSLATFVYAFPMFPQLSTIAQNLFASRTSDWFFVGLRVGVGHFVYFLSEILIMKCWKEVDFGVQEKGVSGDSIQQSLGA
jgi:hypothetical protein